MFLIVFVSVCACARMCDVSGKGLSLSGGYHYQAVSHIFHIVSTDGY